MEILSDATFKGNLNVNGSVRIGETFQVGTSTAGGESANFYGSTTFHFISTFNSTEFHNGNVWFDGIGKVNFSKNVELKNACKGDGSVNFIGLTSSDGSHYNQSFQNKCGTIALTSDIPSLSGYLTTSAASSTYLSKTDASSTYQKKFTTFSSPSIPANCTAFEFTGTAISDSNKTHLIQVQNTSTGKSVIAETWMTTNKKPAMSFAGCTSTVAAGTYTAIVL